MQEFFDYLEYSISRTLAKSADANKRYCWCDGIMPPEIGNGYELQQSGRQTWIAARAWVMEERKGSPARHDIYELKVFLGKQALVAYRAGEDLRSYVPPENKDNWIGLDTRNSWIAVALL